MHSNFSAPPHRCIYACVFIGIIDWNSWEIDIAAIWKIGEKWGTGISGMIFRGTVEVTGKNLKKGIRKIEKIWKL